MTNIKQLLKHLPSTKSSSPADNMMSDPKYIKDSSAIISEALQNGFDVMQLENGDIVTTGVITIVTHYRWDSKKHAMVKVTTKEKDSSSESPKKTKSKKK